jgi:Protein of unknown function (DUF667).
MFETTVQPGIVSLFSSTGTDPLSLFQTTTDPSLPSDSVIHLLHDRLSLPKPSAAEVILPPPLDQHEDSDPTYSGHSLDQTVLHIQSPTLPTTFIRCPRRNVPTSFPTSHDHLGIKHPWMHIQVRNMGREWSFESGLVDKAGHVGVVRVSTFQVHLSLTLHLLPRIVAVYLKFGE